MGGNSSKEQCVARPRGGSQSGLRSALSSQRPSIDGAASPAAAGQPRPRRASVHFDEGQLRDIQDGLTEGRLAAAADRAAAPKKQFFSISVDAAAQCRRSPPPAVDHSTPGESPAQTPLSATTSPGMGGEASGRPQFAGPGESPPLTPASVERRTYLVSRTGSDGIRHADPTAFGRRASVESPGLTPRSVGPVTPRTPSAVTPR
jgi:hypothetical protein